jgi:trigger factor
MTHTVRETGPWQRTLTIELPPEDVERRLTEVTRRFQQAVSLPGFRKGKVPIERVRQDYAAEIEREFLERTLPEVTHAALDESQLRAIVPPAVQNVRFTPGQPLAFDAVIEVMPEPPVRDWKGLPLVRRTRPVNDAAVEATLERLRDESAVFVDLDRAAGPGDVVLMDSQRIDANARRLAGTRAKGARILLGAPGLMPEIEQGLTGALPGQERTLTVTYPADYRQEDLAGQTVRYIVNIKKIQAKKLREPDDNFARDVFGLDAFATLRDRVRANLEREEAQRVRREMEAQAIDELVRRHPVDLSPRLVAYMLDQVLHEQTGGREIREDLHKQLEEHYRPGVERSLRREILLGSLARQESLAVSADEVSEAITRLADAEPRSAAKIRQRYASADRRKALADGLLETKALDLVLGAAAVRDEAFAEPMELPAGS